MMHLDCVISGILTVANVYIHNRSRQEHPLPTDKSVLAGIFEIPYANPALFSHAL